MKIFPECNQKLWRVKTPTPVLSRIMSRKLGISTVTAQLLINRGIYTVDQGRAFLGSELERLHHPLLMKDMEKAVQRILKAVGAGEKILVYGDYDADGITSLAILALVLRRLGTEAQCYIPNRLKEGYGLHLEVLKRAREAGVSLVVTVDCGISALAEASWAGENGLDLVITDHHEPSDEIPLAFAVINPKRSDCIYPFKELAGVGVALKLAQALLEAAGEGSEDWQDYLGLACLGTVADIVPIQGENRILVKHGLHSLANSSSPGLQALIAASGVKKESLGTREVAFGLAPRLNSAGRIGCPELALKLLLTDNMAEAWELANELNKNNQARQKIDATVYEEALKLLEENPEAAEDSVLVLASEKWHPGVIGIVASRLAERFYRPVLIIALEGEEGKGSARSVPGFKLHLALTHCQEYLLSHGGHALAAGFTVERGMIEGFRKEINLYAKEVLIDQRIVPGLDLDGVIGLGQITEELVHEISMLRPFGQDNPDPLLGCLGASLLDSRVVGKGAAHLKLRLRCESEVLDGIGFNLGAYAEALATSEKVDLAFVPEINEFGGRRSVQLKVKDLGLPASFGGLTHQGQDSIAPERPFSTSLVEFAGEELFLPEFVLNTLDNLEKLDKSYPDTCLSRSLKAELVDCRGLLDRQEWLVELVVTGGPTLVITTCGYQTIELAYYLRQARSSLTGKIACCHGLTPEDTKSVLVSKFEVGEVKVMVATPAALTGVDLKASQVLLYHLPCSLEAVRFAVDSLQPGGRLHLLYGTEDLSENLAGLDVLAPGREYLKCIYILLRKEGNGGGDVVIDPEQTALALAGSGFTNSCGHSVRAALAVIEDLELLAARGEGKLIRVKLFPAPAKKKELSLAYTYKRLHLIKEESIAMMERLLYEPLDSVSCMLEVSLHQGGSIKWT